MTSEPRYCVADAGATFVVYDFWTHGVVSRHGGRPAAEAERDRLEKLSGNG